MQHGRLILARSFRTMSTRPITIRVAFYANAKCKSALLAAVILGKQMPSREYSPHISPTTQFGVHTTSQASIVRRSTGKYYDSFLSIM